jgi:hypothetical protein
MKGVRERDKHIRRPKSFVSGADPTFRMSEQQRTIFQQLGNLLDEIDEK